MARTTEEILATMDAEQASQPDLAQLNSTSQTAIYTLFKNMIAYVQSLFEKQVEAKKAEIQTLLDTPVTPTIYWIQGKTFEFQYSSTSPQVMELIDFVPQYAIVNPDLRIITLCKVGRSISGFLNVIVLRVAKNDPPEKLAAGEVTALDNYWNNTGDGTTKGYGIAYAGQIVSVRSEDPDLVYIEAEITYNGQFGDTIQDDCFEAMQNYLYNLPMSSVITPLGLTNSLQSVQGFVNIFINELAIRPSTTVFASRTKLIDADTLLINENDVYAGYAIQETTALNTWADKITFTAI